MVSEDLIWLADRVAGYAVEGKVIEPELASAIAHELLKYAQVVAELETLPFDVTKEVADELLRTLPEWPIIRAATQATP